MVQSKIFPIILAGTMVLGLVACGSSDDATDTTTSKLTSESETPSESESAEPSETEGEEDELAPDGVWETDGERVTIEKDTVTIDYIDDEGEVTETYWVGSFELDEDSDTWTSTRDPNAEMTCESETIEFTWSGEGDNVYDKLSYAVTNEDGTTTTVVLNRVESLGDVERGVGPAVSESDDTSTASASPSTSVSASTNTSTSPSASDTASSNTASDTASSGSTGGASGSDTASSGNSSGNASSGNSSGNASSGNSSGSASSGNSSGNASSGNSSGSASSGSASSQHTHTYNAGVVTQQATCSTAGVKTYTCTTCGATKTESVPATGQHNWQAVYKTVHHDEVGHWETTNVQDYRVVCRECGWYIADTTGMTVSNQISYMSLHWDSAHGGSGSYTSKLVNVGTTSTWVVDSAGYDEQVLDHYVCSNCNATK